MRARARPGAGALLLSAALALGAGCAASPRSAGPVPLSVAPSQGASSSATPVEIAGVGFDAAVKTDYGDGSGSTVQATFAVRLLPCDGTPAVALDSVGFTQRRTLTAVVPAGLAPGRYDVEVTDPSARSGTLPDGFEVTSDAGSAVAFRIDPIASQRAGVPFAVSVAAVDGAGRVVSGFAGAVTLTDASGTVAPASAGPLVLGRAAVQAAVATPHPADRLTVSDGAGRTGASNAFDVGPGVPARIAFVAPPAASATSCSAAVELELRDAGGAAAPAITALAVALQSGPPGALLFFSDPACSAPVASIALAPGATRGAFHLRGAVAGSAWLRAVPDLLPSADAAVAIAP